MTPSVELAYAIYSLNLDVASGFSGKIAALEAAINGKIAKDKDAALAAYNDNKKLAEAAFNARVPTLQTVTDAKTAYEEEKKRCD